MSITGSLDSNITGIGSVNFNSGGGGGGGSGGGGNFALNNDSELMLYYTFDSSTYNATTNSFNNLGQSSYGYGSAPIYAGGKTFLDTANYKIGNGSVKTTDYVTGIGMILPTVTLPSADATFCLWVNWTGITYAANLNVLAGRFANANFAFRIPNSTSLTFDGAHGSTTVIPSVQLNTWYHIAVVFSHTSSNKTTVYLNGSPINYYTINDIVTAANINATSIPMVSHALMNNGGGTNGTYGNVDDYRLYARALSDSEILSIYNYNG